MRRAAALLALCLLAAACGEQAPAGSRSGSERVAGPSPSESVCACPRPRPLLPGTEEWIPRDPDRLAGKLASTTVALRLAIERWTTDGDPSAWPPPDDVELLALYQQRMYRTLSRDSGLAEAVIAELPRSIRAEARDNAAAGAALLSMARPVSDPGSLRTVAPEPADVLIGYFREAELRFGVDWEVLAAVNYVESKFGRVVSASSAGAQGPMQFIPSTWAAYGLGGDVHDPHDAILGAANYLHASGAPGNYRVALYHYNPVPAYVDAVMGYARQMTRDPRTFYAYYNWQVFVLTKRGDLRLTGPGL
ncbi:MAG: lytic transglycosylase domain-containing protein [Actinomycetota bacterium]